MGPAAVILAFAATTGLNGETPCQQCCAPGGDCSKAFKGTPGKCCGTLNGQAFCCPGISYRGAASGDAKCYNCGGEAYRCYTGTSSRNICGGSPQRHPHEWTRSAPSHRLEQYSRHDDSSATGAMLLLGVAIVVGVLFCFRRQHDHVEMYHASPYAPVGTPVPGKPMYGQQMAYGAQPMAYTQPMYGTPMYGGCGGGYSGMAVAGSAAAGFMGGMMLSEAMDAGHHHSDVHHHHYDGGGGAGDFGGGYGGGGGDGGDFAADS